MRYLAAALLVCAGCTRPAGSVRGIDAYPFNRLRHSADKLFSTAGIRVRRMTNHKRHYLFAQILLDRAGDGIEFPPGLNIFTIVGSDSTCSVGVPDGKVLLEAFGEQSGHEGSETLRVWTYIARKKAQTELPLTSQIDNVSLYQYTDAPRIGAPAHRRPVADVQLSFDPHSIALPDGNRVEFKHADSPFFQIVIDDRARRAFCVFAKPRVRTEPTMAAKRTAGARTSD